MHLGTLELPKASWPKLAAALEARLSGYISAFEQDGEIAKAAGDAMARYHYRQLKERERQRREEQRRFLQLDLASLSAAESRTLGPELVAHTVWRQLQLDEALAALGFTKAQSFLAQALVLSRLLAPELEPGVWLRSKSALGELLADDSTADDIACRRVAALLLLHKEELEEALWKRELRLFGSNNHLILFALSSMVTLAMDSRGFPSWSLLGEHKLGNAQMDRILERLENQTPKGLLVVTLHSDLATEENLKLLSRRDYPHLLVYPTASPATAYGSRRGPVRIRLERNQDGLWIHCSQSAGQEQDPQAEQLFLGHLAKLQTLIAEKKLGLQAIHRRLSALKERFPQVATAYQLELETQRKNVQLLIQKKPPRQQGYVFQAKEQPLDQREAEAQYQALTRMTSAFRASKLAGEADLFLSVLAYHLMVAIEHQLERAGISLTWQDVQAMLSSHQRLTVTFTDQQRKRHRLRISTMPDGQQNDIYRILRVEDPLAKDYQVDANLEEF